MFFRRRHSRDVRSDAAPDERRDAGTDEVHARRGVGGPIWNDRLGRWSIRSLQILLVLTLTGVAVWALVQVRLIVIPVLVALILAAAAAPLIAWLRRAMPAMAAAWITLLGGIIVLGGVITAIVFAVRNQWDELAAAAGEGFEDLLGWIETLPLPIDEEQIQQARDAIVDFLTSAQFGQSALTGVSIVADILTGLILTIVVLFFFLKDGDRIWAFFLRPFRGEWQERGQRVGETSVSVLGGYLRGTTIIALVDSVAIGIGLAILQVPLALPLAVIVFLGAYIPIVGATVAGALAALVALVANGPIIALIVLAIVIGVQQLEGNFLQPVVMAQSLKLHPLVILVALTAGTILAGIIGAVLAVPIAAVGWAIVKVWDRPDPTIDERRPLRRRRRSVDRGGSRGSGTGDSAGGTAIA